jgi:hypothetical protein
MNEVSDRGVAALRALYERPGPYASVYVSVRATSRVEFLPRWRALATELTRQGAGDGLVEVMRDRVLDEVPGPGVLALFGTGEGTRGEVALARSMPGSTQPDLARYGTLPYVVPALEWLQDRPAYLTAWWTGPEPTSASIRAARPPRRAKPSSGRTMRSSTTHPAAGHRAATTPGRGLQEHAVGAAEHEALTLSDGR